MSANVLTLEQIDVLDGILERRGKSTEQAVGILQDMQSEFGYLPIVAMKYVADNSNVSAKQLYGVATFYAQFRLKPIGKHLIKVCHGTACHVRQADMVDTALEEFLGVKMGENTPDMKYTLESVACLGCCSLAPVMMIDDTAYGHLDRTAVRKAMTKHGKETAKAGEVK
jgi:NADH:ubiquinone oxidoreductase subunit E